MLLRANSPCAATVMATWERAEGRLVFASVVRSDSNILCLYLSSAKTGSTWLYEALRTSTCVSFGGSKDLFFFDRYADRGIHWYLDRFDPHCSVWCDLTHDYVMSVGASDRVAQLDLDVRFIAIFRRPGERAYSAYRYMQSQARLPRSMSFETAAAEVGELVDHGRYARNLEAWVKEFGVDAILPIDFAQLRADPEQVVSAVATHLGGIDVADPTGLGVVNSGRTARSRGVVRSLRAAAWVGRSLGAHGAVQRIKASDRAMKTLFREGAPSPDECDRSVMRLIDDRLEPDRRRLHELLGVSW